MARIATEVIDQLKSDVSLLRLVESQGHAPVKQGKDYVISCPFHDEATPSSIITPQKNLFHCFGCGASGSVIDWVMHSQGISFRHAVELLQADTTSLAAPAAAPKCTTTRKLDTLLPVNADDHALLQQVVDYYHQALLQSPEALAYLDKRGLGDPALIEQFRLGYANRTLGYRLPASTRKAGAQLRGQLQHIGFLRDSGHEHFNGSLVVPVLKDGAVVEVYGRKIRDDLRKGTPRHLYLPGPHAGVWNSEGLVGCEEVILCEALLDAMTFWVHGHRKETISAFIRWCEDRGIETPQAITKPILERYQRHLYYHRKPDGQPLSSRSQRSKLTPIRAYFKWLARENHILYNPASDLELPRVEQRLPKAVLTEKEVGIIMAQADINHPLGLRDRAMMETLYSTGIRRMELANLKLHDVDSERGALMVRQGKGKKDRVIPIGERAVAWINHYVLTVRGELLSGRDDSSLFLSRFGEAFTPSALTDCIREYVLKADIGKTGSCHLFRHAMATQMLENGADIRFIQAMLGHADLSTTQVYTQVSILKLKEIHTATHPAKLSRAPQATQEQARVTPDDVLAALCAEAEAERES